MYDDADLYGQHAREKPQSTISEFRTLVDIPMEKENQHFPPANVLTLLANNLHFYCHEKVYIQMSSADGNVTP